MKISSARRFAPRPTYANVIATIALFVALGGAAVAAGLPRNSVGPKQLKRGAVTAAKIRKHAVRSGKIAPRAVTAGKLGANAVLPGNIANGAINTNKIGAGAVRARSLGNGVVTTRKLHGEAVTTAKLGNSAVTSAKLADRAVTPAKLSFETATPGTVATLRSGQTLRGVFDVGGTSGAAPLEVARGAVSYALPLAAGPPAAFVLKPGETNGSCPGFSADGTPVAAAGTLCVYITAAANIAEANLASIVENNTRFGFGLAVTAQAAGEFAALGRWAVTAP